MPSATESNQNSESLDTRVGTLLQEALDAATHVEDGLASPRTPGAMGAGDPVPTREAAAPPSCDAATTENDIDQLDDDLARLTQSLIQGETISPTAVPPPQAGTESRDVVGARPGNSPPASPASENSPREAVGQAPAERSSREATEATPSNSAPSDSTSDRALESREPRAAPPAQHSVASTARPADAAPAATRPASWTKPLTTATVSVLSAPLASAPRIVRDTVGWFALWTLFLAACVWAYVLFVHKPAKPHGHAAPLGLVTEERPTAREGSPQPGAPDITPDGDAARAGHDEPGHH